MTYTSHQAFVDEMVEQCLNVGIRERDEMVGHIRTERAWGFNRTHEGRTGTEGMDVTDKALRHKISLTTSRKTDGFREIYCVPGKKRYLSLDRLRALANADVLGTLTEADQAEFNESVEDVELLQCALSDKIQELFAARKQLRAVYDDATLTVLDLS